jgi:hypothetical protein
MSKMLSFRSAIRDVNIDDVTDRHTVAARWYPALLFPVVVVT